MYKFAKIHNVVCNAEIPLKSNREYCCYVPANPATPPKSWHGEWVCCTTSYQPHWGLCPVHRACEPYTALETMYSVKCLRVHELDTHWAGVHYPSVPGLQWYTGRPMSCQVYILGFLSGALPDPVGWVQNGRGDTSPPSPCLRHGLAKIQEVYGLHRDGAYFSLVRRFECEDRQCRVLYTLSLATNPPAFGPPHDATCQGHHFARNVMYPPPPLSKHRPCPSTTTW